MRENGVIWVLLATLFVMTAFGFVKTADFQNSLKAQQVFLTHQSRINRLTTLASCNYRDFLRGEYTAGKAVLRRNPDGLPALRISRAQLEASILKERNAYAALRGGLVCLKPPAG